MCIHEPPCPGADAPDRDAAHVVVAHEEQGWSLLCNGVIAFDDLGDLLPEGRAVRPPTDEDLLRWRRSSCRAARSGDRPDVVRSSRTRSA